MTKRDVFNEVLAGLREIEAFERGQEDAPHAEGRSGSSKGDSRSEPYGVLSDTGGASVESVIGDAS